MRVSYKGSNVNLKHVNLTDKTQLRCDKRNRYSKTFPVGYLIIYSEHNDFENDSIILAEFSTEKKRMKCIQALSVH